MATFRLTAVPKRTIARAALGAAVLTSAFGVNVVAANADTPPGDRPAAVSPVTESEKRAAKETKVNVTASQVLDFAKSQVGVSENAAGGGTPYQKWYANSQRASETIARDGGNRAAYLNAAWCAMFVSWVGEQTGARPQVGWDAYTVAHAKWFAANDRFGTEARPGAVVFFSWDGSKDISDIQHVGFVVKDNGDGTISTIEGNTGNGKVEERTRPTSQVVGYGYPEYAA
ncbi:CHAP domain-containing protein [Nonomuraea mesophila]|uniref:CHAP domain-containing protein n=1 Tax=Nonomuraea mesophila TaxID=2530382 RepID=A0A4R5FC79_9ACTN|nr:CHAP domain-containing protein [Nonomuraea mesophila]TDE46229.1 CHAP domain-containing protein [Nonomuraea mesophila]